MRVEETHWRLVGWSSGCSACQEYIHSFGVVRVAFASLPLADHTRYTSKHEFGFLQIERLTRKFTQLELKLTYSMFSIYDYLINLFRNLNIFFSHLRSLEQPEDSGSSQRPLDGLKWRPDGQLILIPLPSGCWHLMYFVQSSGSGSNCPNLQTGFSFSPQWAFAGQSHPLIEGLKWRPLGQCSSNTFSYIVPVQMQ